MSARARFWARVWEPYGLEEESSVWVGKAGGLLGEEYRCGTSGHTSISEAAGVVVSVRCRRSGKGRGSLAVGFVIEMFEDLGMTRGWVMKAITRSWPPRGQRSGSSSKTLRIRSAHRRRKACYALGSGSARLLVARCEKKRSARTVEKSSVVLEPRLSNTHNRRAGVASALGSV